MTEAPAEPLAELLGVPTEVPAEPPIGWLPGLPTPAGRATDTATLLGRDGKNTLARIEAGENLIRL